MFLNSGIKFIFIGTILLKPTHSSNTPIRPLLNGPWQWLVLYHHYPDRYWLDPRWLTSDWLLCLAHLSGLINTIKWKNTYFSGLFSTESIPFKSLGSVRFLLITVLYLNMYLNIIFDKKLNFQHHYFSLQCNMILLFICLIITINIFCLCYSNKSAKIMLQILWQVTYSVNTICQYVQHSFVSIS